MKKGILISGKKEYAARLAEHIQKSGLYYWVFQKTIKVTDLLPFPIIGLLHVKDEGVRYKLEIADVMPFNAEHLRNQIKRHEKSVQQPLDGNFKTTLAISKVTPFHHDTLRLLKTSGETVKNPPQSHTFVFIPD